MSKIGLGIFFFFFLKGGRDTMYSLQAVSGLILDYIFAVAFVFLLVDQFDRFFQVSQHIPESVWKKTTDK